MRLKRGIYATSYGNTAYVEGPQAKTAFDLQLRERIPLAEVTPKAIVLFPTAKPKKVGPTCPS